MQKLIIAPSTTIQEALERFGTIDGLRLLLVYDKNNHLVGVITEQDVRRGILRGVQLSQTVEPIINTSPITAHIQTPKKQLLALASQHNIYEIPLLDNNGKVVKIESVSKILQTKNYKNPVIIMAGGLGTRLRPLTNDLPKPMLRIGKKPILEIILERFRDQGFRNIILCVNYKSNIIENYFKDGSAFGLEITYIREEKRLGTAGALSLWENVGKDPFFVMNGDILTNIDFTQMLQDHVSSDAIATVGTRDFDYSVPYGVIESQHGFVTSISEKPILSFQVNAGIYVLQPNILDFIPKNCFFDMPNLFQKIISTKTGTKKKNIRIYPIADYWIDIGRHEEYAQAINEVKTNVSK